MESVYCRLPVAVASVDGWRHWGSFDCGGPVRSACGRGLFMPDRSSVGTRPVAVQGAPPTGATRGSQQRPLPIIYGPFVALATPVQRLSFRLRIGAEKAAGARAPFAFRNSKRQTNCQSRSEPRGSTLDFTLGRNLLEAIGHAASGAWRKASALKCAALAPSISATPW